MSAERIPAPDLMKMEFPILTASELVELDQCSGQCLVASAAFCDCRCGGMYHGRLANAEVDALWPPDTQVKLTYNDGVSTTGFVERTTQTVVTIIDRDLGIIHEVQHGE